MTNFGSNGSKSNIELRRGAIDDLKKFHALQIEAHNKGIRLGDFIEKLIKYFKLDLLVDKDCSGCQSRKEVFNHLRVVGWKIEWDKFDKL